MNDKRMNKTNESNKDKDDKVNNNINSTKHSNLENDEYNHEAVMKGLNKYMKNKNGQKINDFILNQFRNR